MKGLLSRSKRGVAAILLAAILMVAMLALSGPATPAQAVSGGDPGTGSMVNWRTVTFASGSAGITTTTYYVPSGSTSGYLMQGWHKADVFVTADVSGTNSITITPQVSVDLTNWVDLQYEHEGWYTNTRVSEDVTYRVVLSADGTDYVVVPMRGNYMRIKAEIDSSTAAITPTVMVVFKNDGGR